MKNQDILDALSVVSLMLGFANYNENLSQSDKDDMIQVLNKNMEALLERLEADLAEQNDMLKRIIKLLEGGTE